MAQNFHNSTKIEPLSIEYSELLGNDEEENNFQQNTISIFENMKVHKEKIAFLMIFTILIIVLVVSVSLSISNGPVFNVVLFGDSLIGNTESMYHIASKIKSNILVKYPDKAINIFTSGIGGNRIADLKNRMYRDALHKSNFQLIPTQQFVHPDAVVMYWDSDATDVDETGHVTEIRAEYTANLYEVLSTLKEQVKYFAFGGPSLYGERPHGTNRRDDILDDYATINRNAAKELNITYLETRALFWSHLPAGWNQDYGSLTLDGEHHNAAGAQLIVDMFSDLINEWLTNVHE